MFKEFAQLGQVLNQARQLSGKMSELQQQLADLRVTGRSVDGRVTVVLSGQGVMIECDISRELLSPACQPALEQAIVDATNAARSQIRETAMRLLGSAAGLDGGLDLSSLAGAIPGFGNL
jgi:DNA-binding YbaB/EbfC family protein